jgi:hypothetical protein
LWALVNFEIWQRRFFDGDDAGLTCASQSFEVAQAEGLRSVSRV